MEENEIFEEQTEDRKHPFTVISVMDYGNSLHDIQQNSVWSENPYGEAYATVPDDMVDEVLSVGCWCNIEVKNGVLTKITKVEPPYIPPKPQPPKKETLEVIRITREDFDLLDVTYKGNIYYITEEDGTITMTEGED